MTTPPAPLDERELINRILAGERDGPLGDLFALHRPRLWRLVQFRIDPRLRGRIDADDVLQEAYVSAAQRLDYFLRDASRSCFIWLRLIVLQTLRDLHRRHLGTQKRDGRREVSLSGPAASNETSTAIAFQLMGSLTSPSSAAARAEMSQSVEAALETMPELDREVLALRHFEELSNRETALALGITEQAASIRYIRALGRLKKILAALSGHAPGGE